MALTLNTSILTSTAIRSLYNSRTSMTNVMQKLSTGIRINSASDDAADLSLSKNLESRTSSLSMANQNIQTGISKLQTYDGYLQNAQSNLQRIRNLAVQASNGIYSTNERNSINNEAQNLVDEINQISSQANQESIASSSGSGSTGGYPSVSEASAISSGYDANHIIHNANELTTKIGADLSGNFIMVNDIDMSSLGTLTDAAITGNFAGNLDGNGYAVKNLTINSAAGGLGLFKATLAGSSIKNLGVENANITQNSAALTAGILVASNRAVITNCYTTGSINGGQQAIGGLIGFNYGTGTITDCHSSASVTGSDWKIGGLIGSSLGNISTCYSTGNVSGNARVGGLIGNIDGGTITNSYSAGSVNGAVGETGGFSGIKVAGTVTNSFTTSTVNGSTTNQGGFIGLNFGGGSGTNFYKNNIAADASSAVNANLSAPPTGSWDTNVWDLSGATPQLKTSTPTATASTGLEIQTGENSNSTSIYVINNLQLNYGTKLNIDLSNISSAKTAIDDIDYLINYLSEKRSDVGSNISSLNGMMNSNSIRNGNLTSSTSTLKDTDMSIESAKLVQQQIKQNLGITIMQQAKTLQTNSVLQLLQA